MLGQARNKIKKILFSLMKPIAFLPLTPNQFTFLAVPIALIAAFFLAQQNYFFALIFVLLAILIDFLDGSFAEVKNKKSFFGNYFDAVTDKFVEGIFYLGFAFNYPFYAFLAFACTMLESYAKPRVALVVEADNHDWPAIGERADRLLLLVLGLGIASITISINGFNEIEVMLFAIALLTFVGFIQRVLYAQKLVEKAEKEGKILRYLKK